MLASETKTPMVEDQKSGQGSGSPELNGKDANGRPKKRGNLAATLDPLLDPRLPAGRPGRPKGAVNYEWAPETDKLLVDLCARRGVATAKKIVGKKILAERPGKAGSRPDSVRKAVEHRLAKLGISSGRKRRKSDTKAKRWTASETTALLGALGADASIESIAARTGHSIRSVRAKLARLEYQVSEIHGFSEFTVDEFAERFHVTSRQVRRWKEKGWLQTKHRRITDACIENFLQEHAGQIPLESLPREDQVYLLDLGYPCPEEKTFRQNVREILDSVGRQRKPRRRSRREPVTEAAAGDDGPASDDDNGEPRSAMQSA